MSSFRCRIVFYAWCCLQGTVPCSQLSFNMLSNLLLARSMRSLLGRLGWYFLSPWRILRLSMFWRCSVALELNLNLLLGLWPRKGQAVLHAVVWPRRGTPLFFLGFISPHLPSFHTAQGCHAWRQEPCFDVRASFFILYMFLGDIAGTKNNQQLLPAVGSFQTCALKRKINSFECI